MPPGSQNKFFGQKVSKQGVNVNSASDSQLILKDDYTTRTYYDASNPRIALGKLPDNTYGLWVSKPGQDVTKSTASANNNLIFNSNQNVFKIVQTGTVTLTGALAQNTNSISVIVGDSSKPAPAVLCFLPTYSNAGTTLPAFNWTIQSGFGGLAQIIYSSTTSTGGNWLLTLATNNFTMSNDTQSYIIRYYVLQESAQ